MSNVSIGTCEYCGKEDVPVVGTSEVGCYCMDCHELVIQNCIRATIEIEEFAEKNSIIL